MEKKQNSFMIFIETCKSLSKICKITKPNALILFMSIIFIVIASFTQALGLSLIIPVLNGLIDKSHFLGLLSIPVLGTIIKYTPFVHSNTGIFLFTMILILLTVYIENISIYLSKLFTSVVSTQVVHILRSKAFKRYLEFGKAFYDHRNAGELNVFITDESIIGASGELLIKLNYVLVALAFTLTFLVLMILISPALTLLTSILLLSTYYITRWISGKIKLSAKEGLKEKEKLAAQGWNILTNILLVKLHSTKDKESKTFTEASNEYKRHRFNILKKENAVPALIDMINSTVVVAIVCVSIFLFLLKSYSLGRFLVYFVILRRFALHVNLLSNEWSRLMKFLPSIKKILWIFDNSDKPYIKSGRVNFDSLKSEIRFKEIYFNYVKDVPVLREITFNVKKGEMLAIVGPTGAGKTSIINLVPRFYEYNSGFIEINGVNIREFNLESLRKKIGVVSQDIMIMNDTIKNNIIYGSKESEVNSEKIDKASRDAHIYDFIMNLPDGYDTLVGDRGVRLSGGEKQRISIARVILKNPNILILDEATSALDTETEMLIQEAIEKVIRNKTVFVIAHRLSTIKNADWIIVIEKGRIQEQGKLQELLGQKGRLYHYYKLQNLFY